MSVTSSKILIVDDEPELRAAMRGLLESQGYTVVGAQNGKKALHYLTSDESMPDLIVLDLSMPELTGWELASILARYTRLASIPIVVVSALTEHMHSIRELVAASMQKPVHSEALLKVVAQQLKRVEERRASAPPERF
jgi:DNA-binding response OmpR family regulator